MRRRYIYDGNGNQVEVTQSRRPEGPMIMPDIEPYQSMITGEQITSRSRHREHLKEHGCIEVGNEVNYMVKHRLKPEPPPGLREALVEAAYKSGVFK